MTAPALHVDGRTFRRADGQLWSWRMVSDFALLRRMMNGEDLGPVLAQRIVSGANGVRVFGAKAPSDNPNIPDLFVLDPRDPNIYGAADRLFGILGRAGLTCEFDIFIDEQWWGRSLDERRMHASLMYDVMRRHPHVVGELVNEYPKNGITPSEYTQPSGIVCSHGSGLSDGDPALPAWTHTTYHPARDSEWPRKFKSALELQDKYDLACIVNEPIRCDENDGTTTDDWFDAGALAQLYTPGATFHSDHGRRSERWTAHEADRAAAFFSGMQAVPLSAQLGIYAKAVPGGTGLAQFDPDTGQWREYDALRTYGSVLGGVGGTEQWAVVVRPGPNYPLERDGARIRPKAIGGWTVREQRGERGTVVRLTR